ncbi:hypothetical protein LCGC14_0812910 [marine sediment metagenome]|uniref:Uncharacterized protein n=1 Tax=marine sediment metagenome TaxID=412755 RepID=A0A0F9S609_9ZZZZ
MKVWIHKTKRDGKHRVVYELADGKKLTQLYTPKQVEKIKDFERVYVEEISLDAWIHADIETRSKWLQDDISLDEVSLRVLGWYLLFKDAGAVINDDNLLSAYSAHLTTRE